MQLAKFNSFWPQQFKIFCHLLGVYLLIHFLHLWPYAEEVFSSQGILGGFHLNRSFGIFPNVLIYLPPALSLEVLFLSLIFCAGFLLLRGPQTPSWVFVLLWFGWATLFNANNLILNPTLAFLGWIFLILALLVSCPQKFHPVVINAAWIILAVGYSVSGWAKLLSPSWQDGSAIFHVLNNPLARDTSLREFVQSFRFLDILTWATLGLELFYLPLALFYRTRALAWFLMLSLHFGILALINFSELSLAMLLVHWFTFDFNWLKSFSIRRFRALQI